MTSKLVTMDKETAEALNNYFASVFTGNISFHTSQVDGLQERDWWNKVPSAVRGDRVHDHLRNPNIPKSMGLGEVHPRVLRELSDGVAKPLSIIFERSWQSGEVLVTGKKGNVARIFKNSRKKDRGNY